jgi:3-isopropylmalate/(R)-2-methylmalate dehydratase large subunit
MTIQAFDEMDGQHVFDPDKVAIVFDHGTPCPNKQVAALHQQARDFAHRNKLHLYETGEGICHQLIIEDGFAQPGKLIIGVDSHCSSYGAVGAFGTGLGSTDIAGALLTGQTWLKVPESMHISFSGELCQSVTGKDVALYLMGQLGANGANYKMLEFHDPGNTLSADDKIVLCNMAVEAGAKSGIFPVGETMPDKAAAYSARYEIDLGGIPPLVARPHEVGNVCPVEEVNGLAIDQVFLGTCTNGRYSDLAAAADILRGKKIAPGLRFFIAPASRSVLIHAASSGILEDLLAAGAVLLIPGCGPCAGALGGIPSDGEVVLSTANRNFLGRMGNKAADIYLCSPVVAAASALRGCISDPRTIR